MKNSLLVLLFFFSFFLKGQTSVYYPFPDSNAVWCDSSGFYQNPTMSCSVTNIFIEGDTIISGKIYHKMIRKSQGHYVTASFYCIASPLPPFYQGYAGAIRQDTALRKIYFRRPNETADSLLYDFSLNIGDTLKNYILHLCPVPMVVSNIDSVLIGTKYRRRLIVSDNSCSVLNAEIIEGIGSTTGLLEYMDNTGGGGEPIGKLYCFSQNNQTLYPIYDPSSGCAMPLVIANISQLEKLNISPNPGTGVFIIEPETENKRELTVFDVNGKLILKIKIAGKTELDLSDYENGIYIISLKAEDKITYKKLIKN
ncbi:MAG: T9SS type A sorting domain-containing protein [Bacteroidia bacterium]